MFKVNIRRILGLTLEYSIRKGWKSKAREAEEDYTKAAHVVRIKARAAIDETGRHLLVSQFYSKIF